MYILHLVLLLLLLLVSSSNFITQDILPSPYQLSGTILASYASDTTPQKNDMTSYAFSYIGEYGQALTYFEQGYEPKWFLMPQDSLYFLSYKPVNAKEYILNRAKNEQIVILNEAHHNPLHRVFTASLLEELYRLGFRYFGAETLNYGDSTLNQRKYPVLHSGYYTREPQYGNLIREALGLGFQVFAYEATSPEEFANGKSREIAQARNIEKVLQKDPKARVLIHCGYAHVQEAPLNNSWEKAMAGRVKEFTGIDPFTIDQEIWTEKSEPSKENPLYRMINVKQPSVFLNVKEEAFSATASATALTDIRVAHPRTTFRYGRPSWLLRGGKWKPYFLKKQQLSLGFPCLVLAYKEGEQVDEEETLQQAIPVDVVELKKPGEEKALILPKGNYRIMLINEQGNKKSFFVHHVK